MRPGLLTALLLLCAGAAPLIAQAPPLAVVAGGDTARATPALHRGFPAYPATALAPLGAVVVERPGQIVVRLFGDSIELRALSPFLRVGSSVSQLAGPVYREGGVLYLPRDFFTDWLPGRRPDRLRFDGVSLRLLESSASAGPETSRPVVSPAASRPAATPAPASPRVERRVVIIDPGHGGRDPGTVAADGIREKDVVLAVGKRLAALLDQRGFEVHLTRQTDTLVALDERPRLANRWKDGRPAALFLSLHVNSGPASVRGFETYFLSEARTEDERRVAELENAAVEYEEDGGDGFDPAELILLSLKNDFYVRASNDLAEAIQQRMGRVHVGPNRGVKQAGFRVLVGASMPAALVELAFLSNRGDARLLTSPDFQQKAAWAIAEAVGQFFVSHEHLWTAEATP